jgi:hypothetical protein
MKLLVLLIIILSLYLIYRLSFPQQPGKQEGNKTPPPPPADGYEAVIKSRFVLPAQSNSAQHDDRMEDSEKQDKKADIFAAGNEKPNAVIPSGELDEVFGEDVNPEELDIPPDEETETEFNLSQPEADEEAEELRQTLGKDADGETAGGLTYEELAEAVRVVKNPQDEGSRETARILSGLEKTDMFEQLVSGDTDSATRIASILDRNEQSLARQSEDAEDNSDDEYRNFEIEQFLS